MGFQSAEKDRFPPNIFDPRTRFRTTRPLALSPPEIVLPYFPHVTGTRPTKKTSSTQSHLAVNPFSRPLSAFSHKRTTYSSGYRGKVEKISLYEGAYVVTRDEHRDRQIEVGRTKGERFGGVPGKLALELFDSINLPGTPCISPSRSPFLARALIRCFSFPSFHSSDAVLLEMKCRGFINLYLPPIAFCAGVDSQLYNPGTTDRRAAVCIFVFELLF